MGIKDLLFGKKQGGDVDDQTTREIRDAQAVGARTLKTGLGRLEKAFGSGRQIARSQIAREQRGIEAAKEDALRKQRKLIAQRGLGRSSIGLGQEIGLEERAAQKKAATQASEAERVRESEVRAGQALVQAGRGAATIGPTELRRKKRAKRGGGISGLLGTAVGGFLGGAEGAKLGGALGGGAGQIASQ